MTRGVREPEIVTPQWSTSWSSSLLIIAVTTAARIPLLSKGLNEIHGFRQSQTALTTQEFARHGIDLFHPSLPVLGLPTAVPMEFPLFQALASLLANAGMSASTAGRLLGLVCFQVTAVLIVAITRRLSGPKAATVALVLFELTPYGAQWATASLIEYMATAFALGALLSTLCWSDSLRRRHLVTAAICLGAAFLVKPTTAAPWSLPLLAVLWSATRRANNPLGVRKVLMAGASTIGLGLALGLAWTRWADHVKGANPFAEFLTSDALQSWNFGTVEQRAAKGNYLVILHRITETMTGPLLVIMVALAGLALTPRHRLEILTICAVPFLAIGTFFNLYIVHDYYLGAVFPAIVISGGVSLVVIVERLTERVPQLLSRLRVRPMPATLVVILIVFAFTWTSPQGGGYRHNIRATPTIDSQAQVIAQTTPADARLIVTGCDWNPLQLFQSDRSGLMLRAVHPSLTPHDVAAGGYTHWFACDPANDGLADLPHGWVAERLTSQLWKLHPTATSARQLGRITP